MLFKTSDFSFSDDIEDNLIQENPTKSPEIKTFEFSENVSRDYPFLVKFHTINRYYSTDKMNMEKLLNNMGIVTRGSNMYCPFHNDEIGGKPSAKYHPDSDMIYCFSESKVFTAWHTLKELYAMDMEKVFRDSWMNLNETDKEELLRRYSDEDTVDKREFINPIWKILDFVTSKFKNHEVTLKQHKNALYKIMSMISESKKTSQFIHDL